MNTTTQVTFWQALEVGRVFLSHPRVSGVSVVGSVARDKRGNDLDMVVVTTGICYASFVCEMSAWTQWETGETDYYGHFKQARRSAALNALQFDAGFCGWLDLATRGFLLDVHLMPSGWKEHVNEVQRHLPHLDPNFVGNIARDAVELVAGRYADGSTLREVSWP